MEKKVVDQVNTGIITPTGAPEDSTSKKVESTVTPTATPEVVTPTPEVVEKKVEPSKPFVSQEDNLSTWQKAGKDKNAFAAYTSRKFGLSSYYDQKSNKVVGEDGQGNVVSWSFNEFGDPVRDAAAPYTEEMFKNEFFSLASNLTVQDAQIEDFLKKKISTNKDFVQNNVVEFKGYLQQRKIAAAKTEALAKIEQGQKKVVVPKSAMSVLTPEEKTTVNNYYTTQRAEEAKLSPEAKLEKVNAEVAEATALVANKNNLLGIISPGETSLQKMAQALGGTPAQMLPFLNSMTQELGLLENVTERETLVKEKAELVKLQSGVEARMRKKYPGMSGAHLRLMMKLENQGVQERIDQIDSLVTDNAAIFEDKKVLLQSYVDGMKVDIEAQENFKKTLGSMYNAQVGYIDSREKAKEAVEQIQIEHKNALQQLNTQFQNSIKLAEVQSNLEMQRAIQGAELEVRAYEIKTGIDESRMSTQIANEAKIAEIRKAELDVLKTQAELLAAQNNGNQELVAPLDLSSKTTDNAVVYDKYPVEARTNNPYKIKVSLVGSATLAAQGISFSTENGYYKFENVQAGLKAAAALTDITTPTSVEEWAKKTYNTLVGVPAVGTGGKQSVTEKLQAEFIAKAKASMGSGTLNENDNLAVRAMLTSSLLDKKQELKQYLVQTNQITQEGIPSASANPNAGQSFDSYRNRIATPTNLTEAQQVAFEKGVKNAYASGLDAEDINTYYKEYNRVPTATELNNYVALTPYREIIKSQATISGKKVEDPVQAAKILKDSLDKGNYTGAYNAIYTNAQDVPETKAVRGLGLLSEIATLASSTSLEAGFSYELWNKVKSLDSDPILTGKVDATNKTGVEQQYAKIKAKIEKGEALDQEEQIQANQYVRSLVQLYMVPLRKEMFGTAVTTTEGSTATLSYGVDLSKMNDTDFNAWLGNIIRDDKRTVENMLGLSSGGVDSLFTIAGDNAAAKAYIVNTKLYGENESEWPTEASAAMYRDKTEYIMDAGISTFYTTGKSKSEEMIKINEKIPGAFPDAEVKRIQNIEKGIEQYGDKKVSISNTAIANYIHTLGLSLNEGEKQEFINIIKARYSYLD